MNLPFKKLRSEQADYLVGEALDIMLSKAMATGLFSGISTGMSGASRIGCSVAHFSWSFSIFVGTSRSCKSLLVGSLWEGSVIGLKLDPLPSFGLYGL
ncbi:hypothetical protein V6N12_064481 [Hibiscus sabdariffa]|uniref:Uncharacterized protein n=1 Tax=Hibiscus sabdariffa TaxID=183260 RepID=A0ABR2G5X2_9ROSI